MSSGDQHIKADLPWHRQLFNIFIKGWLARNGDTRNEMGEISNAGRSFKIYSKSEL